MKQASLYQRKGRTMSRPENPLEAHQKFPRLRSDVWQTAHIELTTPLQRPEGPTATVIPTPRAQPR